MKLSVVIPTHNRPEFLKRAIEGLEKQDLNSADFEVIVILSPNDQSFAWLDTYNGPLNIRHIHPKEDQWQGRNVSFKRNYGAQIAKASWIAFTDDDCLPQVEWLSSALGHLDQEDVGGIEGLTQVPEDAPHTLTWKGMRRLAMFGGYQTCNVFYRKSDFLKAGGFDNENFPWFLEDTDLAWSILDLGKKIVAEPKCLVVHPVGPRASWRILHEANRAGLKLRLLRKHPEIYFSRKMAILRWPHWGYLMFYIVLLVSASLGFTLLLYLSAHLLTLYWLADLFKKFNGLQFTWEEVLEVGWRILLFPILALTSIIKEQLNTPLPFKTFIKALRP